MKKQKLQALTFVFSLLTATFPAWAKTANGSVTDAMKLLFYVRNNNLKETENLLRSGISADLPDPSPESRGETALMKAVINKDLNMIRLLLKYGANINSVDERGESAVLLAAYLNQFEVVRYLQGAGADINLASKAGITPIMTAADHGNLALVKYLLSKGASLLDKTSNGFTLLMAAAKYQPEVTEFLIQKGLDVNAQTSYGGTALMVAAKTGNIESLKTLLNHGAKVHLTNKAGHNALFYATPAYNKDKKKTLSLYDLLLQQCLKESQCLTQQEGILFSVIYKINRDNIFPDDHILNEILLHKKFINKKNHAGFTPLDIALVKKTAKSAKTGTKNGTPFNNTALSNNVESADDPGGPDDPGDIEAVNQLIDKIKDQGGRQTIPEIFSTINDIVQNDQWFKIRGIFKKVNWKRYLQYINSAFPSSYRFHYKLNLLYLELARNGYWDKEMPFDVKSLEVFCRNQDERPFNYAFHTSLTAGSLTTVFNVLTGSCLGFTEPLLNKKLKTETPAQIKNIDQKIYQYLIKINKPDFWGYSNKGLGLLIQFLVNSHFHSPKPLLTRMAIKTQRFYLLNLINKIEDIHQPLDKKQNSPFHYVFFKSKLNSYSFSRKKNKDGLSIKQYRYYEWLKDHFPQNDLANKNGTTPLMLACKTGAYSIAEDLLKSGARPAKTDRLGLNAMDYAVIFRQTAILKLFNDPVAIENSIKKVRLYFQKYGNNKVYDKDKEALIIEYRKRLTLTGPGNKRPRQNPEEKFRHYNQCIIAEGIEKNNAEEIRKWLKEGYSPECRVAYESSTGFNALEAAIYYKRFSILKILVEESHVRIPETIPDWIFGYKPSQESKKIRTYLNQQRHARKK